MRLITILEKYEFVDSNKYYAYHVTDSFHIVKNIFRKGFRATSGAGRVCFSYVPWSDFGIYVIKVLANKDEFFNDDIESGSCPSNVKPMKWGFIFSQSSGPPKLKSSEEIEDSIFWVNKNPSTVNLMDYKDLVERNAVAQWQINNWRRDATAEDENVAVLSSILGRGYSYQLTDIDKKMAERILGLLKSYSLVEAFKKSKLKVREFKDYVEYLRDEGLY